MSEQDNDAGNIESAANAGNFEGSVSAEAPGSIGSDLSGIEANMSVNNGGGVSDPSAGPQMGRLDLDPNVIGAPIAVMDRRVDQPSPSLIATNLTSVDVGKVAATVGLVAGAVLAVVAGSPQAVPLAVAAAGSVTANMDVLERAVTALGEVQLQTISTGVLGAFASWEISVEDFTSLGETVAPTLVPLYDGWGCYIGMGPPPEQDYWQMMGIST